MNQPNVKASSVLKWLGTCVLALGMISPSFADQVTLGSAKDNTLYESATGSLSNGAGSFFFVGQTAGNLTRRGLLAFDLSSIPTGATIDSVDLTLAMTRSNAGATDVSLHQTVIDWGEGTSDASGQEGGGAAATTGDATWIHSFSNTGFWTNAGGDFSVSASATTSVDGVGSYTWSSTPDLVADVQSWYDNPASNFGWTLAGTGTAKQFGSRENATVGNRPSLTINYTLAVVPEPTSTAVLGLLSLATFCIRRRR